MKSFFLKRPSCGKSPTSPGFIAKPLLKPGDCSRDDFKNSGLDVFL